MIRSYLFALALGSLLALPSAAAHALTICSGPCPPDSTPPASDVITSPDLGELVAVPGTITQLVFTGESLDLEREGDIVLELSYGAVSATNIHLRAEGDITMEQGASLNVSGVIEFCSQAGCGPGRTVPGTSTHHVRLAEYVDEIRLTTNGSIYVTTAPAPVPEPSTALLVGLGLAGLAGARRSRQS